MDRIEDAPCSPARSQGRGPFGSQAAAKKWSNMHRHDIDGLRAVAVLPVIAFHFMILPTLVTGGFVGVDVFFVISGFLITRVILFDVNNKTYSIADFYNRRIRRIFPALFAVFVFCLVVTFVSSLPSEATQIGRSIVSSIFFVSNYLFYTQSGYFDRNAENNPLLHTWSLSVEEQFYVIFPLVIYAIRNLSEGNRILLLWTITAASFLSSSWMVFTNSPAAFFLVQFRAWELLIGSLLAIGAIPMLARQWQAEALGIVGILLIAAGVFAISTYTPFPGFAALAPCLGAAAIIHSGQSHRTLTSRTLSLPPLRFIGLISYSLYLWHWPLIVFYRLLFVNGLGRVEKVALVAVCILVATISWRFIEQPFRTKPYKLKARGALLVGGAVMIVTASAAIALPELIQSAFKYPSRAMEVLSYAKIDESHLRAGTCLSTDIKKIVGSNCLEIKTEKPNFLLLGDSHAAHLWTGLHTVYPEVNFLQATVPGCKPIFDDNRQDAPCVAMMQYLFQTFLPNVHLDGIIISARWGSDEVMPALLKIADKARAYADRVIVVGPMVEYDQALPRILAHAIASNRSEAELANLHRLDHSKIDQSFSTALAGKPIEYISIYRALCAQTCEVWTKDKIPLQFDNDHFTCEGSIELARRIGSQLLPNLPQATARDKACE
jgi:peptidoglycan/LPS O-acetylase OafA/YrhL